MTITAKAAGAQAKGGVACVQVKEESIETDPRYAIDVYADFAKAIRADAEPFVKPAETLAVMRLLERCRREAGRILATPL